MTGERLSAPAVRLGLLLLLAALAGCEPAQGKVSGRVLFDGKPLPGGWVTFRPADPRQNAVSAEIDAEGHYSAVLPAGDVQISVDNRELEPKSPITLGPPPGLPPDVIKTIGGKPERPPPKAGEAPSERRSSRYVKIPDRYYALETSGLQLTVKAGEQTHDIELTK